MALPLLPCTNGVNSHVKEHFTPMCICITKLILVHVSEHFEKRELHVHVAVDYFHIIYNMLNILILFVTNNCA